MGGENVALAVLDVLMWGVVVLFAFAIGLAILFAFLVRMDWLDTVWHYMGRYLRWRKGK